MTRRMTAFILTCLTVLAAAVSLSACAPQPAEPAFLEKIGNAMIFASQGNGQDNDLSIEAIVSDADSPKVAAYLDKLRSDTGNKDVDGYSIYKHNFDYIKEVMQMDSATIDDALYDALILTFTEMSVKDKEKFLEYAYTKDDKSLKWNANPVIGEMVKKCNEMFNSNELTYDNLTELRNLINSDALLIQIEKYNCIDSDGVNKNINVSIEKAPDSSDVILSLGFSDAERKVEDVASVHVLSFRSFIDRDLNDIIKDERAAYALYLGASISYTEDGEYSVNLTAIDPFGLNIGLRAFARAKGNEGLGCSSNEVAKALDSGKIDELTNNNLTLYDYIEWYREYGTSKADVEYRESLKKAYKKVYRDEYFKKNGSVTLTADESNNLDSEAVKKMCSLTYEDMVKLEQDYPEYFE